MTSTADTLGPPPTSVGVIGWLRKNLFSSWSNSVLTIICLGLIYAVVSQLLIWTFTIARWPSSQKTCACS